MAVGQVNTVKDGLVFSIDGTNKISGFQDDTRAADFDGTSYLFTSDDAFDLNGDFSIGMWIYRDSADVTSNYYVLTKGSGRRFEIVAASDINYNILMHDGAIIRQYGATPNQTLPNDVWHFICMSYDSSTQDLSFYSNGTHYTRASTPFVPDGLGNMNFNTFYGGGSQKQIGKIDNAFFYDKVLSQSEMDTLYNSGLGTPYDNADKTNLISWWAMSESSGDRFDRIGGKTLTESGAVGIATGHVNEPFSFDYVRNMSDGAMGSGLNGASLQNTNDVLTRVWDFDGVNDYIDFGDILSSELLGDFTISMWVKHDVIPTNSFMFYINKRGNDFNAPIQIGVDNRAASGRVYRLFLAMGNGTGTGINTLTDVLYDNFTTPNEWVNITFTIESTNANIYRDGILFSSETFTGGSRQSNTAILKTGTYNGVSGFLNGNISNVKIYNRALTPAEIKQNYNSLKYRFI